MNYSKKITVNINVVNLGQIDLLVEKGFYSNRIDFIKTAIRNQIKAKNYIVKNIIIKNNFIIGVTMYTKKDLKNKLAKNEKINIKVIGMLILKDDITKDLALKVFNSIEVKGIFKANAALKNGLAEIIKTK